jgi:homogentisate 1,2-dioxygenase
MRKTEDYQNIFHWTETQKDGEVPSFKTRLNDPYTASSPLLRLLLFSH